MHTTDTTIDQTRPRRPGHHLIREWRDHRGMTAKQVAANALDDDGRPMSGGMISQLEAGRAGYTQHSLERIARSLQVEPWMLLAVRPDEQDRWLIVDGASRLWRELPETARSAIWRVLFEVNNATFLSVTAQWRELFAT